MANLDFNFLDWLPIAIVEDQSSYRRWQDAGEQVSSSDSTKFGILWSAFFAYDGLAESTLEHPIRWTTRDSAHLGSPLAHVGCWISQ
jgi:hypothetical protein